MKNIKKILCPGFKAAGIASGLKKNGEKDLGLIFSTVPSNVAGMFTRNRVQGAHILLDRERIKSGLCQAVVVNSGNANCCTGKQGIHNAKAMAGYTASSLGISENHVLVASTGVIGEPLPIEKIKEATPGLVKALASEGFYDLAEAIMTTDTVPKIVSTQGNIEGKTFTITGIAKGSGMICPDMATMLCFICTDIKASSAFLKKALCAATKRSFNRITIDSDMSTNDTIIIMANGVSKAVVQSSTQNNSFQKALDEVMISLAKKLIKDGEGSTKLVEIAVKGALSDTDAYKIAGTVANSNLVKTAFFGEDANWGRIVAAAGRADVPINPDKIDIFFDDIMMVKNGLGCGKAAEAKATKVLKKSEFTVLIDLHQGKGYSSVFTCDFSIDYVKINADYRS
ncbi:MAG: bifunctional glutamate N-acetyltransferase/amino-acid acetyltransferase ArgJ [Desulfobacterales bacterium]|uniref:Arginine biosynthesis bifunctional protein ArgJ n=1 Tax=Candidatus Desulfaltia bathyphila TaxID=2841697 RepID=A0A8J6N4P1_9BACT|nr:bifunctional glutamate N-acetyltransferase/amino-acid acetyltransferase ArgJ [Candidatus Desulfaltia bathyphila]MBL7208352.1 bifunctional glutamate N-acetyltransferase/amino-acid acetyltransferase ArgJ [Desulfobacterales bacterium]